MQNSRLFETTTDKGADRLAVEAAAVILAAGQGTRMRSQLAKVLHPLGGLPMVARVVANVHKAGLTKVYLVVGHQSDKVQAALPDIPCVIQEQQLGTGHAVDQCRHVLAEFQGAVLVTYGDTPLFRPETLAGALEYHSAQRAAATVITAHMDDPTGYGRVKRDAEARVLGIVEQKDASDEEQCISEINTGTYCFDGPLLFQYLQKITTDNVQAEYYLPDVLPLMIQDGHSVVGFVAEDARESMGINDRVQLAQAETILQQRLREHWMLQGVTMVDPSQVWIDDDCRIGQDTTLYPGVHVQGGSTIGSGCRIGPNVRLQQTVIGDETTVEQAVLIQAQVGSQTTIGPFAYLRPGAVIGDRCKIGDFVEVKNSVVANDTSAAHHIYLGDADVGQGVNVGCGTITCNYDGRTKSRTIIEDGAFIGSNSALVAPVTIGRNAFVAAGSTITEDVPPESLGIARGRQVNKESWTKRRSQGDSK